MSESILAAVCIAIPCVWAGMAFCNWLDTVRHERATRKAHQEAAKKAKEDFDRTLAMMAPWKPRVDEDG